jgi:fatty-acyl-CoA synthase
VSVPSYVHCPNGPPLVGSTTGAFLRDVVAKHGGREAVISASQRTRLSYAELLQQAETFASGLIALGLDKGDRLGIWAPNRVEWTVIQFAAAMGGLVLVNINPAYRLTELEHVVKAAGCKAVIIANRFKTSDYVAMVAELVGDFSRDEKIASDRLPVLRSVIVLDDSENSKLLTYRDVMTLGARSSALLLERAPTLNIDDAVNIQFTSGTPGFRRE